VDLMGNWELNSNLGTSNNWLLNLRYNQKSAN
jgi:hypothetical protein